MCLIMQLYFRNHIRECLCCTEVLLFILNLHPVRIISTFYEMRINRLWGSEKASLVKWSSAVILHDIVTSGLCPCQWTLTWASMCLCGIYLIYYSSKCACHSLDLLVNMYWTECVWVVSLMNETDPSNAWLMPVSVHMDVHVSRKPVAQRHRWSGRVICQRHVRCVIVMSSHPDCFPTVWCTGPDGFVSLWPNLHAQFLTRLLATNSSTAVTRAE